jgi:type IV secretory pathway VirB2 component (pilin)
LKEYTMKTLRRLCAALVLTLALALSAFGGEIATGVTAPPPPPQATATGEISTTVTGDIATGVTVTDPVTETLLSLLQSLLSLF